MTVGTSGTGGGFEKFCAGETDISDASREIEPEEDEACKKDGIGYEDVHVATDALTVMINNENPVSCLTVDQLSAVWGPDSKLSNWDEIPGLEEEFDEELALFGPGTDSGTFDYFTEEINGEEGATRKDYNNVGENDNATVTGVEGSPGGMGYAGFSYYTRERRQAESAGSRQRQRLRRPLGRNRPGRLLRAAQPAAVHLPERRGAEEARGQGVRRLLPRKRQPHCRSGRLRAADRRTARRVRSGSRKGRRLAASRLVMSPAARRSHGAGGGTTPPAPGVEHALRREGDPGPARRSARILSVLTTTAIVISLIGPTIGFFEVVPIGDFLFGTDWTPQFEPPSFGVLAIVAGTLNVTLWAMLFAIPIGLGSAIYLSEYARPRVRKTLKPVLEILAGIPTVAIGFFAVSFILPRDHPAALARRPPRRRDRQAVHGARRRARHRPDDRADHRLDLRGRDVGGARAACAKAPTRWARRR